MTWEQFAAAFSVVAMLIGSAFNYGYSRSRLDDLKEAVTKEVEQIWKTVHSLQKQFDQHEKEASTERLSIAKEIGQVRETGSVTSSKLDEILKNVAELSKKMDRLDGHA